LRISRGRLKTDDQTSGHQLDNKRKRNSSRENSLESLLEEEDGQTSEDCTSRDSLPYLEDEDGNFRPQQKNSLDSLLDGGQGGLAGPTSGAVKHKTNSLPKSSFSNIQLRVQEIRDQLEVLKQSSSTSGSKALQQVFPRIRPPNLATDGFLDDFEDGKGKAGPDPGLAVYSTPVNPTNPIYNLNSSLVCSARPGFLNNRPLSMPSPPLANSPGNSPNSLSPRSLSPNGNSPKHNIRPSTIHALNPNLNPSLNPGKRDRREAGNLPNPFSEFGPSPVSSPSTLSPCSSNSLPSSQAGHLHHLLTSGIMGRNANSLENLSEFLHQTVFLQSFNMRIRAGLLVHRPPSKAAEVLN
jgi:hypothetical protein